MLRSAYPDFSTNFYIYDDVSMRFIGVMSKDHLAFMNFVHKQTQPAKQFVHIKQPIDVEGVEFKRLILLPDYDTVKDAQYLLNLATLRLRE